MRAGLVLETLTHLALALTTEPAVAFAVMFVFGFHAFVWGTTSRTIRQRSVPVELQGRVGSVYLIGVYGGMLVGAPIGGLLAREWGVAAPFWFGFVGSALLVVLLWRALAHVAHDPEPEPEPSGAEPGVTRATSRPVSRLGAPGTLETWRSPAASRPPPPSRRSSPTSATSPTPRSGTRARSAPAGSPVTAASGRSTTTSRSSPAARPS